MTFYRHFIERPDFKTLVATSSPQCREYDLPYEPILFQVPKWFDRISRTRFSPWISGWQSLYGDWLLPPQVMQAAQDFQPDAVFTVAGSWHWTALAALRVARHLQVPLIASFNDWYDYGWFPAHPRLHRAIENRFRQFYREADLALCTSEGMREALGDHPKAHILYPTGAVMPAAPDTYQPQAATPNCPMTVFFGGSLADWYGPMLEVLIGHCRDRYPEVQFRIFGSRPTWSREFDGWATATGVYRGQVPFEALQQAAHQADLLLLPMGFGADCAQVERTSFKTKFLDYLSFRRPILVWGPDYCSAARTAREFDSAECVTRADPAVCGAVLQQLAQGPERRTELMNHAYGMYCDRFHPDKIHQGLVQQIRNTMDRYAVQNPVQQR